MPSAIIAVRYMLPMETVDAIYAEGVNSDLRTYGPGWPD